MKPKPSDEALRSAGKSLHDNVAPLLAAAGLKLQLVRMDHPEAAAPLNDVLSTLDQAMEHVREISQKLSPSPFTPPARKK